MFATQERFGRPDIENMRQNAGFHLLGASDGDGDAAQAALNREDTEFSARESLEPAGSIRRPLVKFLDEESQISTAEHVDIRKQALTGNDKPPARPNVTFWLSEILSLLAAVCLLIAIVVILALYNNKEQPQWTDGDTLNLSTLVAVLATIFRSLLAGIIEASRLHQDHQTMEAFTKTEKVIGQLKWAWYNYTRPLSHLKVFDEATRGPLGSAKFLSSIPRVNLATFASIISLASVGIGAFTQQSIRTIPCEQPDLEASASIPIAFNLDPNVIVQKNASNANPELEHSIKVGLISGLAALPLSTVLQPICDSGNCKFQATNGITHSSLGLSSYCVDTTSLISQTGAVSWSDDIKSFNGDPSEIIWSNYSSSSLSGNRLGYTAIGGWYPFISTEFDFFDMYGTHPILDLFDRAGQLGAANASIGHFEVMLPTRNPCQNPDLYNDKFSDPLPPLPSVNTSLCPELHFQNVTSLPGYLSLMAASCIIYPSVQNYFGSVINGKLEEYTVGEPIPVKQPTGYEDNGTVGIHKEILRYISLDPCVVDGVTYSGTNMTDVPGGPVSTSQTSHENMTGPRRCVYGLSDAWNWALFTTLQNVLYADECTPSWEYANMFCRKNWWLEPLYNQQNASLQSISQVMDRMAKSLTDQMRMAGTDWDGNRAYATGTAYRTRVCTHFIWQWIFFPFTLFVGVAVLLVAIILDTVWSARGRLLPVWKASILPTMFYGLEEENRLQKRADESELLKIAKTKKIRLGGSKAGWRMVEER